VKPAVDDKRDEILAFWFGDACRSPEAHEARAKLWFIQNADFDHEIAARFGDLPERAASGELDPWAGTPRGALALVLVLDQFPRNLYRGSGRAFAFDEKARTVADSALDAGFDQALHPVEARFLYLPFEHAEDLALQDRCVDLMETLVGRAPAGMAAAFELSADFARRHRVVIRRFGRFPHRNAVLGRPSTPEEEAYLRSGGEVFGAMARTESDD
jgi:uncharacterized protein (DUF924 family)